MRRALISVFVLCLSGAAVFLVSPWPGALVIRWIFDQGSAAASEKLEARVRAWVSAQTFQYDPADHDALLDIYKPSDVGSTTPVVVWVHGGGFVSGSRRDIANYLRILAGRGFVVIGVDYGLAPRARYPTPVRQVTRAIAYLSAEGGRLGIDATHLVIAGDSAGAQIASQVAAAAVDPAYATRLGVALRLPRDQFKGVLLFCGVYDVESLGRGGGVLGWFVHTVGWAYSGVRDWRETGALNSMSVAANVTAGFPPAFISAGNADPLLPQSIALAEALKPRGVQIETLFFPVNTVPPLGHEYQFDLDGDAGKVALERVVEWLRRL